MWFFIALAPRSTIIPSPELICDYKTYLASIGWLFVLATSFVAFMHFILTKIKNVPPFLFSPMAQFAIVVLFAFPLGYGAMIRNVVWSTPVEFWRDISIKAPGKARGHNNLGVALSEEGRFAEAIPCYLKAISLDRFYSDPWSNLAVAYSVQKKEDKAISALKQAIKIFPHYPEAYNNLGTLMIKKKNYDAAEKILQTALKLRPYYGKAFYNLGRLYNDKGEIEKAWEHFKKATEGDLDTTEGFFTYGQMSLKLKKFDHAIKAFSMALKRGPNMKPKVKLQVLFNLANSHFMLKDYDKAYSMFEYLCKADPGNHRYWYNLGETLYSQEKYEPATKVFKKLTQPPFNFAQACFRLAHSLEKINEIDEAKQVLNNILDAKNAPENFKKMAQTELGRLNIQQRINKGNCTLTQKELREAFSSRSPRTTRPQSQAPPTLK